MMLSFFSLSAICREKKQKHPTLNSLRWKSLNVFFSFIMLQQIPIILGQWLH